MVLLDSDELVLKHVEFLVVDEPIVDAVLLTVPRWSGGRENGPGETDIGKCFGQCGLTASLTANDDDVIGQSFHSDHSFNRRA